MKNTLAKLIFISLILINFTSCANSELKPPKNIIIFIGDGMGFNHINATSYYQYGELGKQIYDSFPVKLAMSTNMVGGATYNPDSVSANFNYVLKKPTDSAASGTALATGTKTYKSGLSVDSNKTKLLTVLEKAEMIGKSTGVVSTVPFSNATPAAFVAHNESRYEYKKIAEEMIMQSSVDVIIGGGHPYYNPDGTRIKSLQNRTSGKKEIYDMKEGDKSFEDDEKLFKYVGGKNVWNLLIEGKAGADADNDGIDDPWTFIQDREQFQKLAEGATPKRLLGVYKCAQSTQVERNDSLDNGIPFSAPLNDKIPTLTEMTLAAINVLDNNPKGFVMMSEGGAIDWVAHSNILHRTIEEQIDFNKAIEAACSWVEKNSSWDETLIIVTADHETGYLLGPNSNKDNKGNINSIVNNGKDKLPSVSWFSKHHTNLLVPFYAKGLGSEKFLNINYGKDFVYGDYIDNTDVGKVVSNLLKLK